MGPLTEGGYAGERASETGHERGAYGGPLVSEEGVLEMSNSEGGRMRRMIVLVLTFALGLLALVPSASAGDNFVAPLSGAEEVPARDTPATGVAKFKLREDGTVLLFKVNVSDIENAFAAHIHCGAVGVNGPVGVTLFAGAPAAGAV